MSNKMVLLPATIGKISTLKDRSVSLVVYTRELSAEQSTALFGLFEKEGYMLFSPNEIRNKDIEELKIPDAPSDPSQRRSKAQTLRACLFKLWEFEGKKGGSEAHYDQHMEDIINYVKRKLPER